MLTLYGLLKASESTAKGKDGRWWMNQFPTVNSVFPSPLSLCLLL